MKDSSCDIFTVVKMTMLFWVVTPRRLVGRYQRFGEAYGFHLQGWQHLYLSSYLTSPVRYQRSFHCYWCWSVLKMVAVCFSETLVQYPPMSTHGVTTLNNRIVRVAYYLLWLYYVCRTESVEKWTRFRFTVFSNLLYFIAICLWWLHH
jgi:hypothetical protein